MAVGTKSNKRYFELKNGGCWAWDGEKNVNVGDVSGTYTGHDIFHDDGSGRVSPKDVLRIFMHDGDENYVLKITIGTAGSRMAAAYLRHVSVGNVIRVTGKKSNADTPNASKMVSVFIEKQVNGQWTKLPYDKMDNDQAKVELEEHSGFRIMDAPELTDVVKNHAETEMNTAGQEYDPFAD